MRSRSLRTHGRSPSSAIMMRLGVRWRPGYAMRMAMRAVVVVVALGVGVFAQPRGSARPVLYEGARLIIGDATPPIESGAFLVEDGQIRAVGARGSAQAPAGATRVDLAGKTVMPAMVNVHVHIGYEGYTTWQARNHTPANVLDHLQREAFYGVAATTSV